jgi:hypothetical protein
VHPFQFLQGQYSHDLYNDEVRCCAPAFIHDNELRSKVEEAATKSFDQLHESPYTIPPPKTVEFKHKDITFCVVCASDERDVQ